MKMVIERETWFHSPKKSLNFFLPNLFSSNQYVQ